MKRINFPNSLRCLAGVGVGASRLRGGMRAGAMLSALIFAVPGVSSGQGELKILRNPELQTGGWRLEWQSTSGERYLLQRSADLTIWEDVTTVTAAGTSAAALDAAVPAGQKMFWRVKHLGADNEPPVVSLISARLTSQSGGTALELTVTASDNVGVVGVDYVEGGVRLGAATAGVNLTWRRIVPVDPASAAPRSFRAEARDAAGNSGSSPIYTYVPGPEAPVFIPLTSAGRTVNQGLLGRDAGNRLLPFAWLPSGNGGNSPATALQFHFPQGGRVVNINGQDRIEADRFILGFGADSPLQFDLNGPTGGDPLAARGFDITMPGAQVAQVPLEDLTVARILALLGKPADAGLPMVLFGRFPVRLLAGTITEDGIRGARWDFSGLGFPLPPVVEGWAESVLDLTSGEKAVFPISGSLPLPDAAGGIARLEIGRAKPCVLTLCPDGSVSFEGSATLVLASGARFEVAVSLNDPVYCLTVAGSGGTMALMDRMSGLLPGNPAACVPGTATDSGLDAARSCLDSYLQSYGFFAQAAGALRPGSPDDATLTQPASPVATASAALESVVSAVLALPSQTLPSAEVHGLVREVADRLTASAPGAGRDLALLRRLKSAVDTSAGRVPGLADPLLPALQQSAAATFAAAVAALNAQTAESPEPLRPEVLLGAAETLAALGLNAPVAGLAETERGRARTAFRTVSAGWLDALTSGLGVVDGQTNPAANPLLTSLPSAVVRAHWRNLRRWEAAMAAAALPANERPVTPTLDEVRSQLAGQVLALASAAFEQAAGEENVAAGLTALNDLVDLADEAARAGVVLPPTATPAQLSAKFESLAVLIDRESALPRAPQTRENLTSWLAALTKISLTLPLPAGLAAGRLNALHAKLVQSITPALEESVLTRMAMADLIRLLQAGTAASRAAAQFGSALTTPLPWEANQLSDVVDELEQRLTAGKSVDGFQSAIGFLFAEAARFEADATRLSGATATARQNSRRLYQLKAAQLLAAFRTTALELWLETQVQRGQHPDLAKSEALLPGGLVIENAGGTLCYNRDTREISGSLHGTLRLPGYQASLTLSRATFSGGGAFELAVHGSFTFPPAPGAAAPLVRATIPESQPVTISWQPETGLSFSGLARFVMSNGLAFTTSASFLDPVFQFSFEAQTTTRRILENLGPVLLPFPGGSPAFTADQMSAWATQFGGYAGAAADIAGLARTTRNGNAAAGAPDREDVLTALGAWTGLNALDPGSAIPPDLRDAATDLIVEDINAVVEAADFATRDGGALNPPPGAAPTETRVTQNRPQLIAFQVDAGSGRGTFAAAGPAQDSGVLPPSQLSWNLATGDVPSGLIDTSGAALAGVSLDFGTFAASQEVIPDFTQAASSFTSLLSGPGPLLADGLAGGTDFLSTTGRGVAVRVTGLGPGCYRVFMPSMQVPFRSVPGIGSDNTGGQLLGVARRPSGSTAPISFFGRQSTDAAFPFAGRDWVAGSTFMLWTVDLASATDDLILTAQGQSGRRTGLLQGFQIVETLPAIVSFTADPPAPAQDYDSGTPITLKWDTRFGRTVEIQTLGHPESNLGVLSAPSGQVVIHPQGSIKYELIVSNSSGTARKVLFFPVKGKPDYSGLEAARKQLKKDLDDIRKENDKAAEGQLNGRDTSVDPAVVGPKFCHMGDVVLNTIIADPSLQHDLATVQLAAGMALDLEANKEQQGIEPACLERLITEAIAFIKGGRTFYMIAVGQTGDAFDQAKIDSFSMEESFKVAGNLLGLDGTIQKLGNITPNGEEEDPFPSHDLVLRHFQNTQTKAVAALGSVAAPNSSAAAPPDPQQVLDMGLVLLKLDDEGFELVGSPELKTSPVLYTLIARNLLPWARARLLSAQGYDWRAIFTELKRHDSVINLMLHGENPQEQPEMFAAAAARDAQKARLAGLIDAASGGMMNSVEEAALLYLVDTATAAPAEGQTNASTAPWLHRVQEAMQAVSDELDHPLPVAQLVRGRNLLEQLVRAARLQRAFKAKGGTDTLPAALQPAALFVRLEAWQREAAESARSTAVGTAKAPVVDEQAKFLDQLAAAAKELGATPVPAPAANARNQPRDAAPASLLELCRRSAVSVSAGAQDLAGNLPVPQGQGDLQLPGGLQITRVAGALYYNRDTGFLRGSLGGRLEQPDSNFSLNVDDATLASDGSYSLALSSGGEVPLGGPGSRLFFQVPSLTANGTAAGQFSFSGAATLGFDNEGPGRQSVSGNVSYSSADRRLSVGGAATGLKFGEQAVLMNGNISAQFSTAFPQGALTVSGRLGLMARGPLPEGRPPADTDFWIVLDVPAAQAAVFAFTDHDFTAEINGGSITLPPDIFVEDVSGDGLPFTTTLTGRLCVRYDFVQNRLEFCSAPGQPYTLDLANLRFAVPGLPDSEVKIITCALELKGTDFPVLKRLNASVALPLPGPATDPPSKRKAGFVLTASDWRLDGFPASAGIALSQTIPLVDLDAFGFDLLGADIPLPGFTPAALTISRQTNGNGPFTRLELTGGLRVRFGSTLLKAKSGEAAPTAGPGQAAQVEADGALRIAASGSFTWDFVDPLPLPQLTLGALLLEGRFELGSSSLALSGPDNSPGSLARITIPNAGNLFRRTNANPFIVDLAGSLQFPQLATFSLAAGSRFVWKDPNAILGEFEPGGFGVVLGENLNTLLGPTLPVYLKQLRLDFTKTDRPFFPSFGQPSRLDLDSLKLTVSAEVNIPPMPPVNPDGTFPEPPAGPRFGGAVDGFSIEFPTGNLLAPKMNANSVSLSLAGLDIPPLGGLEGSVALLNLDQLTANPPHPERVTFVGQLGGKFAGKGASVLLAAQPQALIGTCFSVDTSPAGIPLDGGLLGGVLWVGAEGGINFQNGFKNPCNFRDYLQTNATGQVTGADDFSNPADPRLTNGALTDPLRNPGEKPTSVPQAPNGDFDPFDCLKDNWPPKSFNPLCEEVPGTPGSPGRLVFLGTRLSAADADLFLNSIGLTENDTRPADQLISDFLAALTTKVSGAALAAMDEFIAASGKQGDPALSKHFHAITDTMVASLDDVARPILRGILQPVGGVASGSMRQRLRTLLTQGIPCFNVTFLGSGTFTHAAVAPALSLKGTISASTTGAALAKGELLLVGVPVAEASLGVSLTKEFQPPSTKENPNPGKVAVISPFLGGLAKVAVGPLKAGEMTMSATMPDAAAVLTHFNTFVEAVSSQLTSAARTHFEALAKNARGPQFKATAPPGLTVLELVFGRTASPAVAPMTDAEKFALLANLFNTISRSATAVDNPLTPVNERDAVLAQLQLNDGDLAGVFASFETFLANTLNSLSPEVCFGGKVEPSIFDIPLTASGKPIASARMRYGRALTETGEPVDPLDPTLKAFSASVQFSPTFMLLAPITGVAVALNPSSALLAGATALDSAELGMSLLIPGWTTRADNNPLPNLPKRLDVHDFLTDQPKFFRDRAADFFDSAVFGAGYSMRPFGMELATAELRVIFPRSTLHPLNPNRTGGSWVHPQRAPRPATGKLPTSTELILAALQAGKLKAADWRGEKGELDKLFPPAGPLTANGGGARKVQEIANQLRANDANLTELAGKSFAADYFPYGGIIGGGALELPQILTRGLPPQMSRLAVVPADGAAAAQWITDFQAVLTFLASSDAVGQLGFYLPAPNPALLPANAPAADWAALTPDSFLKQLRTDPAALIGQTANPNLFAADEIVFAGWAKMNLLGLPVGEASIDYNRATGTLLAEAEVEPNVPGDGNWLNDFVQAKARFEIQMPASQKEGGLKNYGLTDLFRKYQDQIGAIGKLTGTERDEKITELRNALLAEMPRVSAELGGSFATPGTVTLPSGLKKFAANASLGFFAYSPYFKPDFEPANDRPFAVAKRNGGIGLKGTMDLGYYPVEGGAPAFAVNVTDASMAITLSNDPVPVPAFSANLEVGDITLPNTFSFNGQTTAPFQFKQGRLSLNTAPEVGGNFLAVEGKLTPINLGPFLKITPLASQANPDNLLAGTLRVQKTATGEAVNLAMRAATLQVPLLGKDLSATLSGTPGKTDDFTFSTVAGQTWGGSFTVTGPLVIRDPFNFQANGEVLFKATPAASRAFTGSITGTGLTTFTLRLEIANGGTVELFPDRKHGSKFEVGSDSRSCLYLRSDGRFYYDSGTRTIPLGGPTTAASVANVTGRVEFGYEPSAPAPVMTAGTLAAFSTVLADQSEQVLTVAASGAPAKGSLVVDATIDNSNTVFSVEPPRLVIPAGGSGQLRVRHTPRTPGTTPGTLRLTPVGQAAQTRALTGTAVTVPLLHVSQSDLDFGTVPVGTTAVQGVRFNNLGSAALTLTIPAPAAPFSRSRSSLTIAAGSFEDLPLTFFPTTTGAVSKSLTITTNHAGVPSFTLTLTGNGANSTIWRRVRHGDGMDRLDAVALRFASPAPAVLNAGGLGGLFLTNNGSSFSWARNGLPDSLDVRDMNLPADSLVGWAVGSGGLVLQSADGGNSWSRLDTNKPENSGDWRSVARISVASNFAAFAGRDDKGDGLIVRQTAAASFVPASIPANTPGLNALVFTTGNIGIAVGADKTLLRTIDGGANWSAIAMPAAVPAGTDFFGVAASAAVFVAVGEAGHFLRSTDNGLTWARLTGVPSTQRFNDVSAFVAGSTLWHAVGGGGVILTSTNGLNWNVEESCTTENLTSVQANLFSAAVTEAGDILVRGSAGGTTAPLAGVTANFNPAHFTDMVLGQRSHGEIIVTNSGGAPLTAQLASSNPEWAVNPSGNRSVPPGGALRFAFHHTLKGASNANLTLTTNDSAIPTRTFNFSAKAKTGRDVPVACLHGPAWASFGSLGPDKIGSLTIPLENIGLAAADRWRITVRSNDPAGTFSVVSQPTAALVPDKTGDVTVEFVSSVPGTHRATLEVQSDAWNGVMPIELEAVVAPVPEQVVMSSSAPEGTFNIKDQQTSNSVTLDFPAVFEITDGATDLSNFQLHRGDGFTLSSPTAASSGGLVPVFREWTGGNDSSHTFTAGSSPRVLSAGFVRTLVPGSIPGVPKTLLPSCADQPPADAPAGPWFRLSDATLTLPWLGGTNGTPFKVEGSAYASLSRLSASLSSSGVRVTVPNVAAMKFFKGAELIEVTPGRWRFDLTTNPGLTEAAFAFNADQPGLQIFNKNALPPASFALSARSNATGPLGTAAFSFATSDDLVLVPQILAIGPTALSGEIGMTAAQPAARLGGSTTWKALAKPAGGYALNQAAAFEFNPALPRIAPLTVPAGTSFDLLVAKLQAGSGATVGPVVTGSAFGFEALNWNVRPFNSDKAVSVTLTADTTGSFNATGNLDADTGFKPFAGAPFTFLPKSAADTTLLIQGRPLEGKLRFHAPAVWINSTAALWPADTAGLGSLDFDSASFKQRLPLSVNKFNGFGISTDSGADADNYLEVETTGFNARFSLRSRQSFSIGQLRLDFDLDNAGLSAGLHGQLGLAGPPPLDQIKEQVSLFINSAANAFELNRTLLLGGARFRLGTATSAFPTGQACTLIPNSGDISSWATALCLP